MHRVRRLLFYFVMAGMVSLGTQWTAVTIAASHAGLLGKSAKASEKKTNADAALPEDLSEGQIDRIMAGLSDEQVRQLLINELRTRAGEKTLQEPEQGFTTQLMGRLDFIATVGSKRIVEVLSKFPNLPADFRYSTNLFTGGKGLGRLITMGLMVALILLAGFLVEQLQRRLGAGFHKRVTSIPVLGWGSKLGSVVIKALPDFFAIFVFALSSVIIYLIVYGSEKQPMRMLFLAALLAILIARLLTALSRMVCSPTIRQLRLIGLSDAGAQRLHRTLVRFFWIAAVLIMADAFLSRVILQPDSISLISLILGTLFIGVIAAMILKNKHAVAAVIRGCDDDTCDDSSWFREQVADIWHLLALGYLFLIWLLAAGRLIIFDPEADGAFFISLLIIPIYLLLDRIGMWIISTALGQIEVVSGKGAESPALAANGELSDADDTESRKVSRAPAVIVARRLMRVIIIMALGFWLLRLWGISIPYGKEISAASFDIFVTLVLALALWRLLSRFIERKLK
ncbi:MAG: hypothetical protein ACK2T5_09200, partial [Anaerolineales bacterium]